MKAVAVLVALALVIGAPATGATNDVTVDVTTVAGSDVKELRARGIVAAAPRVVRAVIADVERYASFMPYVRESRIVGHADDGDVLNYQRLSFPIPFVSDRHYVIRITERPYLAVDGRRAHRIAWRADGSAALPSVPSAIAVSLNYGYWDLTPEGAMEEATAVEYCVFTDSGGSLPKWMVTQANRDAIPKLFEAVRAAAAESRYAVAPALSAPADGTGPPPALPECGRPAR